MIAETTDLPTKFARIVVTDDQGRYVIPDLPTANYSVWVRGYGLVDSPKLRAKPGQHLDIAAVPAPNDAAAAHYYPAIYWYAMMKIPPTTDFGKDDSGLPPKMTQVDYLKQMKNIGCIGCHQLGQEATRTIPAQFGPFKSGADAWMRRIQSGQSGEQMINQLAGQFAAACRSNISATGPTASPRASCRRTSRRGRKASSATSWSLSGSGPRPTSTCTT